jgi:hypothetical protein
MFYEYLKKRIWKDLHFEFTATELSVALVLATNFFLNHLCVAHTPCKDDRVSDTV